MFLIVRPLQLFKGVQRIWTAGCAQNCAHRTHTDHNNEPQSHNWKIGRCVRAADHDLKLRSSPAENEKRI